MFLHEHLWIQLLLALTILPCSLCFFSGSNKQSQTRQQPHVPALGKCYNLQTQLFMTPVHVFFLFVAVESHIHLTLMMFLKKVLLFMFCFYFWNTDTLNQNCYARTIEVTTSVSSGNDGDKWDSGAFVSSTVEHNFAKDVMLMMKHALTGFHDLSRSPSLLAAPSSSPEKCVYLAVTCCCGSQNEIQRPFVPISFSYQAKCSLETGLITRQDPQSR